MARQNTSHYEYLSKKWAEKQQSLQQKLRQKHGEALDWVSHNTKQLGVATSLAGLTLLSSPVTTLQQAQAPAVVLNESGDIKKSLITDLSYELPDTVIPLSQIQEDVVGATLSRYYGFKVTSELEGKKLNRSYGYIGQEQHLARFPGDSMEIHFDGNSADAQKYGAQGMAPGLGAWGYFTHSQGELTQTDTDREKWYIATQTFLAPGYMENVREYSKFFKHRKMLVVNPENGKAAVAVIGDAGPGKSTGKHLGGSPELMKHLERVDGRAKGPVLYFFIDDPTDRVPLGPIEL